MNLDKKKYWKDIVDYYYDNIHWDEPGPPSIYEWLQRDYGATANLNSQYIYFKDLAKLNWFLLRWGT